nr:MULTISPECIES: hypothetical protein [unclassified Endozoicomonas]
MQLLLRDKRSSLSKKSGFTTLKLPLKYRFSNADSLNELQRFPALGTEIDGTFYCPVMADGTEWDGLSFTAATIQKWPFTGIAGVVAVRSTGRQSENLFHNPLPLPAMGTDFSAKQLVSNEVCDFMAHGMRQKMLLVFFK